MRCLKVHLDLCRNKKYCDEFKKKNISNNSLLSNIIFILR